MGIHISCKLLRETYDKFGESVEQTVNYHNVTRHIPVNITK